MEHETATGGRMFSGFENYTHKCSAKTHKTQTRGAGIKMWCLLETGQEVFSIIFTKHTYTLLLLLVLLRLLTATRFHTLDTRFSLRRSAVRLSRKFGRAQKLSGVYSKTFERAQRVRCAFVCVLTLRKRVLR